MKKLLLIGLISGAVFSASAMDRGTDRPYSAPIMNKLTEEDVEVRFDFARGTQPAETINLPARHETKFEFDRMKTQVFPETVTVTIRDPKTVAQKTRHKISGSTVTKKLQNNCFGQIEIVPSMLSTTGFEVKVVDCTVSSGQSKMLN